MNYSSSFEALIHIPFFALLATYMPTLAVLIILYLITRIGSVSERKSR